MQRSRSTTAIGGGVEGAIVSIYQCEKINDENMWSSKRRQEWRKTGVTKPVTRALVFAMRILVIAAIFGCFFFPGRVERDVLYPAEILSQSVDSCAQELGVPKVALMFLLKGPLYHKDIWSAWLKAASGMVPKENLRSKMCESKISSDDELERVSASRGGRRLLSSKSEGASYHMQTISPVPVNCTNAPLARTVQHLFNVYIHLSKDLSLDVLDPAWIQYTENVKRVVTHWGSHSLISATRSLLWTAFRDPLNQRFVLLSESDVPLWDPVVCR